MKTEFYVVRGDGWYTYPRIVRSTFRSLFLPNGTGNTLGFRVMKRSKNTYPVLRGGAWYLHQYHVNVRSALRSRNYRNYRVDLIGFRVMKVTV